MPTFLEDLTIEDVWINNRIRTKASCMSYS